MPHIVIKAIKGCTQEQYQEAAKEITAVIENTLGKPARATSVSVEEYDIPQWEGVYNEFIKDKDNVIQKPGYSDPKTFK